MAETQIEWTDATWNPVAGCAIVSAGCTHCYAMEMARRLEAMGVAKYHGLVRRSGDRTIWNGVVREDVEALTIPYGWRKPRKIFVNSMSDLFHEQVSDDFILDVWRVMRETPHHHYQILTKRPERMVAVTSMLIEDVLPNVWLGTSVENSEVIGRIDALGELAEIGMTIARVIERQVLDEAACAADDGRAGDSAAGAGPIDAGLGLAFARVSRAVRQTLALEEKFDRPRPAPAPSAWDERAAWLAQLRDDPDIARLGVAVHRDDVRAHVEQVIAAEVDGSEAERLLADLEERLDDAEAGEDFADRPLGELVAGICRDLGVTPDWNLWRNEDWAMDEARANTPGSPYARPKPRRTWPDEPWRDPPRSRAAADVHPP